MMDLQLSQAVQAESVQEVQESTVSRQLFYEQGVFSMKLENKVAIITGSTSGMGRATAYLFAKEGARVVVTGRNQKRAEEVVETIKKEGGEACSVLLDLTDVDNVHTIVDKALEEYGTIDILYNNAGMYSPTPSSEITLEEWNDVFKVNVSSPLRLAQLVVPIMKKKGKGIIINTTSVAGYNARPSYGGGAYITSKHALEGLSKSLAVELGPEIRVNAIAPGAIETGMFAAFSGTDSPIIKALINNCTMKRLGKSEDIAAMALFLATDESSYITGQSHKVDGCAL